MRYTYVGRPGRITGRYGQPCNPVRRADGRCIMGRKPRNQLVVFADGALACVPARCLRLTKAGQ